jgi:hypothetical protein
VVDPGYCDLTGVHDRNRIHILALGMYANICRTTNSIEREIAERQLEMKAINDNSWFSKFKQISPFFPCNPAPKRLYNAHLDFPYLLGFV